MDAQHILKQTRFFLKPMFLAMNIHLQINAQARNILFIVKPQ